MIREEYKQQLIATRGGDQKWGSTAAKNGGPEIARVLRASQKLGVQSVLDFGCGLGTLGEYIRPLFPNIEWNEYDPSIAGKDTVPTHKFDLIVSTDVMEHIEPDSLNDTLRWIRGHARIGQFHMIACGPTNKKLPDGRDVHLIQQPIKWWVPKFPIEGWTLIETGTVQQRRRGIIRERGWVYVEKTQ